MIESLCVLALVGVLAAVAYPSYIHYLQKGRRMDAMVALSQIQLAQDRWRSTHASYSESLTALQMPQTTPDGFYTLSVSGASASGYTATATATGAQTHDGRCESLHIVVSEGRLVHGSTGSGATTQCWSR